MNYRILNFTLLSILLSPAIIGASSFPARLAITVSDDDGAPIAGVQVHARTNHSWHPGEGFGWIKETEANAVSNTQGKASIRIDCHLPKIQLSIPRTAGFYHTRWRAVTLSKVQDRRWEPWDQPVEFVLKRIKDPIPMYARKVFRQKEDGINEYNTPFGFDLMVGDWVAPRGKGVSADMFFTLLERIPGRIQSPPFHYVLRLTFPNPHDGIQPFPVTLATRSELRIPRIAPSDGFQPIWEGWMRRDRAGQPLQQSKDLNMNYFFRVRTITDSSGKIISALYGKIYDDIAFGYEGEFVMNYYLNPTPLDRNVEFALDKNLSRELSGSERPLEP